MLLVRVTGTLESVLPEDATDYEWWKWAQSTLAGVSFILIDAKLNSITIGHTVDNRHKHFYHWTRNETYKD